MKGWVQGDAYVLTQNSWIPAKDIAIGQSLMSCGFVDLSKNTNFNFVLDKVVDIKIKKLKTGMTFNKNHRRRFSLDQPILVKKGSSYATVDAFNVEVGTYLLELDGSTIREIPVSQIRYFPQEMDFYQLITEGNTGLVVESALFGV